MLLSPPAPAPRCVRDVAGPERDADRDLGPVTRGRGVKLVKVNEDWGRGVGVQQTLQ